MCGDTNCQTHDCGCSHGNYKCHCHEDEKLDYNGYRDGDIVGETNFEIIDKDELAQIDDSDVASGNLGDDLVKLGFLDKNDDLYKEMKKEKRTGKTYEI